MMTKTKINASEIKVGDTVLPPAAEMRMWMRRTLAEKGLPESALHLTVAAVSESTDRRGHWVHIKGQYGAEWTKSYQNPAGPHYMNFKALANKPWPVIR